MQVQKQEVRQRILAAARDVFHQQGYKKTSMREIARRARITPGNIYAYYAGKEELLDAVVAPTAEQLRRIYDLEFAELPLTSLDPVVEELLKLFLSARAEFAILIRGAAGSKYGNCKQMITDVAALRIEQLMPPQLFNIASCAPLLAQAWAAAVIEGLLVLFDNFNGNEEQLRLQLSMFLNRLFPLEKA